MFALNIADEDDEGDLFVAVNDNGEFIPELGETRTEAEMNRRIQTARKTGVEVNWDAEIERANKIGDRLTALSVEVASLANDICSLIDDVQRKGSAPADVIKTFMETRDTLLSMHKNLGGTVHRGPMH